MANQLINSSNIAAPNARNKPMRKQREEQIIRIWLYSVACLEGKLFEGFEEDIADEVSGQDWYESPAEAKAAAEEVEEAKAAEKKKKQPPPL